MAQTSYSMEGVGLKSRWYGDSAGLVINPAIVFATTLRTVEVQKFSTGFWASCFVATPGFQSQRERCDIPTCLRRRGLKFDMSYYFPAWFVEKKIELTFRSMPLGGPQISIKMASIVSNGALLFKYTHIKDLVGIQSLFSQGLAAPSDAGHLDGCTALHFAVEHGSVEVIDFLIKTDADRDALNTHLESPATYAWDIILGNSMEKKVVDFLRATFSDRDFLEGQNFNHTHQIVLGLNSRTLTEALKERPQLIDSTDARGNTPLIWAVTRGDTENVQELLEYGVNIECRNNNGWNALYSAVNHSRLECTATLLSYGYNDFKDKHSLNVDEQDVFQRCPLALAAWRNNALGVAYLLEKGANREIWNVFGATPLLRAIQYAAVDAARVLLDNNCDVLAVDHESQILLHRAALSRDVPTIELLAEKKHALRNVDVNAKDSLDKIAKKRLQEAEPSAELLKAFIAMIAAIKTARQSMPAEEALARQSENDQEVFKDAIEYQSDGSAISSCQTTDNEERSAGVRCKGRARLTKPLKQLSQNWAAKYRNTFRSFDRHVGSASTSTVTLIASRPNG